MEITEAPEIPSDAPVSEELVEQTLDTEITKDIETGTKPKKPRSEAQKAAFVKARQALAEKRKATSEAKAMLRKTKKKPGQPPKPQQEAPQVKKEKKVQYVLEESSSSSEESSSESEEEVVYVKRSKGQKGPKGRGKPKKKQGQRIVYVSSSSEEEELTQQAQAQAPAVPPTLGSLYAFV